MLKKVDKPEMRAVIDYNGYVVTKGGFIKSLISDVYLKPCVLKTGYKAVALYRDKKSHTVTVHRLVAKAFIPNPNNYPCVNHINGCKTDNRVTNLEWCDHAHNNKEAFRIGLNKPKTSNPSCRKPVIDEATGIVYHSLIEASKQLGIRAQTLSRYLLGIHPNKTTLKYL